MFLFHIMFGVVGLLLRLPRRLLLGLVLFVLGLVLLELVHPSPREPARRAAAAQVSGQIPEASRAAGKTQLRRAHARGAVGTVLAAKAD